jgi:hypothetical protein
MSQAHATASRRALDLHEQLPLLHAFTQGSGRGRLGEQSGDDGHGIGAGAKNIEGIFEGDAADGDQRLLNQRAAAAYLFHADHGIGIVLGGGGKHRAEGDVIHGLAAGGRKLTDIVAGKADHGARTEKLAGVAGREIVLAHVQAGFEQHGEIGAVVYDERHAGFAAQSGHLFGGFEDVAAPVSLVADLQNAGAAFQECSRGSVERDAALGERCRVENRVEARYVQISPSS